MIMRSVVLFIALCITLASAQTCVPITKNAAAGAATAFKFQNTLGFNIVPVYYSTSSSNVELAVQACSDDAAAVNGLKFDFATSGSSIVLTTSTSYTTSTTTTAPATTTAAPTTRTTSAPSVTTAKPSSTVDNAAQRVAPFSTLLAIVAGLMLVFRPQSQSSILVVLVMICALYFVQAASTITITVRIGLPDTISQVCAGDSCSARSTGGVTDFVTVFGDKFAALSACSAFTAMPEGWRVADSSYTNALVAVAFNSWGVDGVVVANGSVFAVGVFNSVKVSTSVLTTQNDATYGTMYKVDSCTYKILIQGFKGQDSNPIVSNAGAISNFVSFMGYDYATLDNNVYTTAGGSVSGQAGGIFLASASVWQVAPFDDNTLVALSSPGSTINNAFGAACLVTANGAAYKSISFDTCGSNQLLAATYTAGNIYAVGANQRVLVRRVSAKGTGNTWPTSVSVFNSMVAGSYQFAVIDNKDPQIIDDSQCQARYYTVPSGWSIPTVISDFASAVIGKGQWTNTTCFVASGTSMDQSGNPCADLQTKNISGTIFYGANKCARVILQRSNNKLTSFTMGMKILFIHENQATSYSDAGEVNLFVTMMQALGIPYDDMYLSDASGDLKYEGSLPLTDANTGSPLYYAIVMSTLTPKYVVSSGAAEALTPDQKNQILQYCYQYGVRRVMLNGYPADSGFTVTGTYNQTGSYIKFNPTFASAAVNAPLFSGIKTTATFAFGNYYSIAAKDPRLTPVFHVTPNAATAPSDANIAAGIVTEANGIQSLQFYFGNPGQFLDHGPVLANFWVDWVTRGVWMGQRRVYFSPQIDDYFLGTAQYGMPDDGKHEVKCNNTDIDQSAAYLTALAADTTKVPAGSRVTLTMAINCAEANLAETTSKLITAARKWQEFFFWESHTWSHMDMTKNPEAACEAYTGTGTTTLSPDPSKNCHNSTYDECYAELKKNNDFISTIWPLNGTDSKTWSKNAMINPAITGLFNPAALQAMYDTNMTCAVGDNSRADLQMDNFYLGTFTTKDYNGFAGIFLIPRFATNIYYNTATPSVNEQLYNDRYGPQGSAPVFPTNHTLDMILESEGMANFRHMAFFRHDPFMFHQCNLHHFWYRYKGTGPLKSWSLTELWIQTVIDRYATFLNFPLLGVKQQDLRDVYFARREREACGLSGTINVVNNAGVATWDKITVQSTGSCRPAITGVSSCGSLGDCTVETYATDKTLWTGMVPGAGKQITVNKAW